VRGCILGPDLAVIQLSIVRKGEKEIEGLTDSIVPKRFGPKRASTIRKTFALSKKDDVRKYVIRSEVKKGDKTFYNAPKIQRLITEKRLRRKTLNKRFKLDRYKSAQEQKAKYEKTISTYVKEKKAKAEAAKKEAEVAKSAPAK
jgi:small subunit ribosomal protein S6e